MNAAKKTKALVVTLMIAGLSMGNEGCEESKDRVLRMDVEVGKVTGRPIRMPSGEILDFPSLANSLFYLQVMNHPNYVMSNPLPEPASSSVAGSSSKVASKASKKNSLIMSEDEKMLSQFGFLDAEPEATGGSKALGTQKSSAASSAPESIPACLYEAPQSQLSGDVISFEATWGAGLGVGYGQNGSQIPAGDVSAAVEFKQARLDMSVRAVDPLMKLLMVAAPAVSHQSDVKFSLDLLSPIPIGADFFYKTPLVKVVKAAMDKGLNSVASSFKAMMSTRNSWDDVWESRVLYKPIVDNDTMIAFRGGYRNNVKVGDTFVVSNMYYEWEGQPCASKLKDSIPTTATPIAEVEVIQVSPNASVARVVRYLIEQNIKPGAQVKILALVKPAPVAKKK